MWNSEEYYEKLLEGWERSETSAGVSYYINHSTEKTQWDHPLFVKTLEELVDMDNIRYAAYRTAMKLRFLQKRLCLDLVDLSTLTSVFERHGFSGHDKPSMDCPALARILLDLFNLTKKRTSAATNKLNTETTAELVMNWILNLYDANRRGRVRVVAVKIALAALSSARLSEKYRYFFYQLRDRTNHVSQKKLGIFLHNLMQIPELLTEGASFGGLNVGPAVNQCFAQAWSGTGITEDELINWLLKEPQTVVWLPTMHRMAAAESVKHESKCSICKAYPIIGFRYRCLKCFNYDLCQQCFFSGRCSKKHKLKHPTQEYCLATDAKEDTKAFMRTVRNNLSKKHRNKKKLCYLPVQGTEQPFSPSEFTDEPSRVDASTHQLLSEAANQLAELRSPDHPAPQANKALQTDSEEDVKEINDDQFLLLPQYSLGYDGRQELESIIHHLEDENRQLLQELEVGQPHSRESPSDSDGSERGWLRDQQDHLEARQEILEAHNRQLELQLARLRLLLKQDSRTSIARSPLTSISQNVPVQRGVGSKSHTPTHSLPPPAYSPNTASFMLPSPSHPFGQTNQVVPGYSPISGPIRGSADGHGAQDEPIGLRHQGLAQQLFSSTPDYDRQLEVNTTDGTFDGTLAQTHYTLPSASQSRNFPEEEAELEDMIDRLNTAYPADESRTLLDNSETTLDEIYAAANRIGTAFSEFLGTSLSASHTPDNTIQDDGLSNRPRPLSQNWQQQQHRSFMESPAELPGPTVGIEISESTSEA